AEDGIRDRNVTGVQTCALPISTSLVPPPISTTIEPTASETGSPAPIAAAMGSSIRLTYFAPALRAASCTALRSTSVTPEGMQIKIGRASCRERGDVEVRGRRRI